MWLVSDCVFCSHACTHCIIRVPYLTKVKHKPNVTVCVEDTAGLNLSCCRRAAQWSECKVFSSHIRSPNIFWIQRLINTHKHTSEPYCFSHISNKTFHSCHLCLYRCRLDFLSSAFAAPISNSLNTVPQSTPPISTNAQIMGFLKNVMSLNKELFSPVAGVSSLARSYNLSELDWKSC